MAKTSSNIFWLTASRVIALVLLAVAYIFLLRYLGPVGAGKHQFVLSYVTIFGVIIDFGIQQYIIKKMSEAPSEQHRYFVNFLATEVVLALIVYASMLGIAIFAHYEQVIIYAIALAGLGTIVNGLTYPYLAVMSANQDLKKVALINFFNSLINVTVITLAIVFQKYIVFLVSNQLIFGLLGLFLYSRFVKKYLGSVSIWQSLGGVEWKMIKQMLLASLPFALLVGFSTIYNRVDMILIFRLLGAHENGLYASAYRLFDLVAFFPAVVSFSLYPVFSRASAQKDVRVVRTTLETYLRFMIALALPMAVGGMLLSKQIILVLAGEQFIAAASVLAVLIWAPAILFIYITANSLVISQLTRFAVIVTATNVILNIIGNLILLPRVGIIGAAIMTVVSEAIQGIVYLSLVKRKITDFSFFKLFYKPVIAALIMGATLYYLIPIVSSKVEGSFLWQIGQLLSLSLIGAVAYGLVLLVLKFFKAEDTKFIRAIFSRG